MSDTGAFRLGVYVCKEAEVVDFASPYGVFSVARRLDPEIEVSLIAETLRPIQTQSGFTVLPNYGFADRPAIDAFSFLAGPGSSRSSTTRACMTLSVDCRQAAC